MIQEFILRVAGIIFLAYLSTSVNRAILCCVLFFFMHFVLGLFYNFPSYVSLAVYLSGYGHPLSVEWYLCILFAFFFPLGLFMLLQIIRNKPLYRWSIIIASIWIMNAFDRYAYGVVEKYQAAMV